MAVYDWPLEHLLRGYGVCCRSDTDKLFHKFARLDNPLSVAVGGTGLGLYWAKKIIDLHDGSIRVDSRMNQGSTFIISIPA